LPARAASSRSPSRTHLISRRSFSGSSRRSERWLPLSAARSYGQWTRVLLLGPGRTARTGASCWDWHTREGHWARMPRRLVARGWLHDVAQPSPAPSEGGVSPPCVGQTRPVRPICRRRELQISARPLILLWFHHTAQRRLRFGARVDQRRYVSSANLPQMRG
jgi:hypothetical protein